MRKCACSKNSGKPTILIPGSASEVCAVSFIAAEDYASVGEDLAERGDCWVERFCRNVDGSLDTRSLKVLASYIYDHKACILVPGRLFNELLQHILSADCRGRLRCGVIGVPYSSRHSTRRRTGHDSLLPNTYIDSLSDYYGSVSDEDTLVLRER